ncbi:hypothetical protein [Salinactinospora qingdaonensis]|uniref:Lipoprotein with Yx(FWY)xxD motif n=1 Tax=Salinactinospora qingdaonensis TaxID=702744 RepID=A0ABP7F526_9ACTN
MRRTSRVLPLLTGALALALTTGCGAVGDALPLEQLSQEQDTGAAADGPTAALQVAQNEQLGEIVTDRQGYTLYRFDEDSADPSQATCTGGCAETWPPVQSADEVSFEGGDESLLGTVARPDGTEQVTLNGWPLYRYSGDEAPGDTNGEGLQDVWFTAAPTGGKAAAQQAGAEDGQGGGEAAQAQEALSITGHEQLGEIVTDKDGYTLYRFDKDSADPSQATCTGGCAETWPPVTSTGEVDYNGDTSLLGTVERPDGSTQVTLGGWPLYRYSGDEKAGDVNGEGVNDTWYATSPLGTKAKDEGWTTGYCPAGFSTYDHPEYGTILVDDQGYTLYRFEKDTPEPATSNCAGECAKNFPPVLNMAQFTYDGVDPADFGAVARQEGLEQVTVNGWPVYRFSGDNAPGDVNGHDPDTSWFAMTPTGGKATKGGGDNGGDGGY